MDKLTEVITLIGSDINNLEHRQSSDFTEEKARQLFPTNVKLQDEIEKYIGRVNFITRNTAYELFPTYATLQAQMTSNIKDKHLELGLDALIDTKLANGGDPFVTRSKLPTIDTSTLASKNDLEELKRKVGAGSGTSTELKGQGFPYNLNADIGTIYTDTTAKNGAVKWIKKSAGTGQNAWSVLFGDVKHKPRISSSQNNAYVEFRRINSTVEIGFGGLSWGWFGIVRRGAPSYVPQGSDRERNVVILNVGGIPVGFRATSSKLGIMTNDKGKRLGTFYLGGPGDGNQLRLQFDDPVPTDRDIGDLRFTDMSYITDDPWPENL
jgi:hypothetical protein|nr:MAG TPA: hypothetical protein [Caudoviricetes sp.]